MVCRRVKAPPKMWSVSDNQMCNPLLHCSNQGMLGAFARKTNLLTCSLSRLCHASFHRENERSSALCCGQGLLICQQGIKPDAVHLAARLG